MGNLSWSQIKRDTFSAISKGNLEALIEMTENYPKVFNAYNISGYSLMHIAAEQNNTDILEFLYSKGIDVNIARKNDKIHCVTPIHNAVEKNIIDNVVWLINHGAKVDTGLGIHATPLIMAVSKGNIEIVKILLEAGANINAHYYLGEGRAKKKITAIVAAKMKGYDELATYLCQNGASEEISEEEEIDKLIESQHNEILEHVERYFGKTINTLSEIIPGSKVAINLHIIEGSDNNDFVTIVTTGMSDLPMDDCDEAFEDRFAELIIKLPKSWPLNREVMKDRNNYWPLGWLRKIAHIPHMYDGWLGKDVILPNGEPPKPVASNTKLSCFMICKPKENGLERFVTSQRDIINFYTIMPIYEEERKMALEKGCEYLIRKLNESGITDVLDVTRENVAL